MTYKYPEMRKIIPRLLAYYEPMIEAQHMGTVGASVAIPSTIVRELKELMETEA